MSCCKIATGCGVPVTGCVGTGVPSGFVSVDLQSTQMPLYVDVCGNLLYYYTGASWVVLGKDEKHLVYDATTRELTLLPDNSKVTLPMASVGIAGVVKLGVNSPISATTDGALVIDCDKLKTQCGLISRADVPAGNVITYNTTTNALDIDCAKLKEKCGLASLTDLPISGTVVKINPTSRQLEVDCTALKTQCNLATMDDIPTIPPSQTLPVSGTVVKINPTSNALEVDCTALKAQCNLASMDDIPTIPATPVYNFGQQASLNGTILHIANSQDPAAGVDVDLSSLSGGGSSGGGLVYAGYSFFFSGEGANCFITNHAISPITIPFYVISPRAMTTFISSNVGSTAQDIVLVESDPVNAKFIYTGTFTLQPLQSGADTLPHAGQSSGFRQDTRWWVGGTGGVATQQGAIA